MGYVHAPTTLQLLDARARAAPRDVIKRWQHKRVLALVLDHVALVEPIVAPTRELADLDVQRSLVVDVRRGAAAAGPGLAQKTGLDRGLRDASGCLADHLRRRAEDAARRAARGLAPTGPTAFEREQARARFKARLGANPISAKTLARQKKDARRAKRALAETRAAARGDAGDDPTFIAADDSSCNGSEAS